MAEIDESRLFRFYRVQIQRFQSGKISKMPDRPIDGSMQDIYRRAMLSVAQDEVRKQSGTIVDYVAWLGGVNAATGQSLIRESVLDRDDSGILNDRYSVTPGTLEAYTRGMAQGSAVQRSFEALDSGRRISPPKDAQVDLPDAKAQLRLQVGRIHFDNGTFDHNYRNGGTFTGEITQTVASIGPTKGLPKVNDIWAAMRFAPPASLKPEAAARPAAPARAAAPTPPRPAAEAPARPAPSRPAAPAPARPVTPAPARPAAPPRPAMTMRAGEIMPGVTPAMAQAIRELSPAREPGYDNLVYRALKGVQTYDNVEARQFLRKDINFFAGEAREHTGQQRVMDLKLLEAYKLAYAVRARAEIIERGGQIPPIGNPDVFVDQVFAQNAGADRDRFPVSSPRRAPERASEKPAPSAASMPEVPTLGGEMRREAPRPAATPARPLRPATAAEHPSEAPKPVKPAKPVKPVVAPAATEPARGVTLNSLSARSGVITVDGRTTVADGIGTTPPKPAKAAPARPAAPRAPVRPAEPDIAESKPAEEVTAATPAPTRPEKPVTRPAPAAREEAEEAPRRRTRPATPPRAATPREAAAAPVAVAPTGATQTVGSGQSFNALAAEYMIDGEPAIAVIKRELGESATDREATQVLAQLIGRKNAATYASTGLVVEMPSLEEIKLAAAAAKADVAAPSTPTEPASVSPDDAVAPRNAGARSASRVMGPAT